MDRTTRNALLLAMLGGLAVSGNAIGQAWLQGPAMDSDGDGLVSLKEHAAGARAMFERMDADHDGHVTAAEMDAGHGMMMKQGGGMHGAHPMPGKGMGAGMPSGGMMAMMDTDRDGAISAQEHAAHAKAMFDKLDTDRNGKVTAAEFAAGHTAMTKEVRVIRHGPGMPAMGMGAGMGHGMSSADRIKKMDRDGDGKVSAAEHAAGAQAMFNEADANKDGNLSTAERAAHSAAMMKRGMDAGDGMDKDDSGGR